MGTGRSQEVFGIFLAILGVLFLLVNNRLVWFGWTELWPLLPMLIGVFLLRVYTRRHKPRQLFVGLFLSLSGVFFFLFSSGILAWEQMDALWPTIPGIIGLSLLSLAFSREQTAPAVVFGFAMVVFAIVGYLVESNAIAPHLSEPFVRIWPLVLVAAGILIYSRAKRERLEAESARGGADEVARSRPADPGEQG